MKRAAIIYHFFPHYRDGVIKALNASDSWSYVWVGADIREFHGIKASREWSTGAHVDAPFAAWGNVLWQWRVVRFAFRSDCDVYVFLANPYYLTTWLATVVCKLRRKRVLFWTHGWIGDDGALKGRLRDWFLRLADGLLLYGHRAREIGIRKGFDPRRMHVIYNSLDYDRQKRVRDELLSKSVREVRAAVLQKFGLDARLPLAVCTARLIQACRFDLLIVALGRLRAARGVVVNLVLVGDGPERDTLEQLGREHGINVVFAGAIYDEDLLGALIYAADVTISPGKIGLTAIHSLMYGTPVITHDRFDRQFPEVEAIRAGSTGAFFSDRDVDSLSHVVEDWLRVHPEKTAATIIACFREVDDFWNPRIQRGLIESALHGEPPRDGRINS